MTRHHGHPHAQRLGNCLTRHATNRASTVSRAVANNAWITKGGLFPCVSHPQPFSRLTYRAHRVNRRPHETPKHLDTAVVMFESSSALKILRDVRDIRLCASCFFDSRNGAQYASSDSDRILREPRGETRAGSSGSSGAGMGAQTRLCCMETPAFTDQSKQFKSPSG